MLTDLLGLVASEGLSAGVQMARSKKACLVFFDEIDAIGGARFDDGAGEALPFSAVQSTRPGVCSASQLFVVPECYARCTCSGSSVHMQVHVSWKQSVAPVC